MPSAIAGFTPTTPPATTSTTGTQSLSSSDFLNLMIQQLEQQDPLNPTDSNQLLTQMSQISQLQSNTQMVSSLQGLTLQQSIGSAGNLIGKSVNGLDANSNQVNGVVSSVAVRNQQVYLELSTGSELPMQNVTSIAAGGTTTGS